MIDQTILRGFTRPWQFTALAPPPLEAVRHGQGSDIEGSLPVLYALVMLAKPQRIVELGTRQGVSTRTLAVAADRIGAELITIDPDPACYEYIKDLPRTTFLCRTGEDVWDSPEWSNPELLFIDTDPHTYEQTLGWMRTWVSGMKDGGIVAFHDTIPARPEIQVTEAVEAFLVDRPTWIWRKLATDQYGLGLLWVP